MRYDALANIHIVPGIAVVSRDRDMRMAVVIFVAEINSIVRADPDGRIGGTGTAARGWS